jgi:radical SAM protein with 4Fe4S-binding SPASM domain
MDPQLSENERALGIIKHHGPKPVTEIADVMGVTTEGARFHLLKLEKDGFVESQSVSEGRGRPKQIWSLTQKGHDRFPDAHADLTINLINMMQESLGQDAVDQVIGHHEQNMHFRYSQVIDESDDIETRLSKLAEIRTKEGYMADYMKEEDHFLFIENHCPICSAAKICQGFCRAEKNIFQTVLGDDVQVERTEHIIEGARRCCYKITSTKSFCESY